MTILTRQERERLVLELYNQGKTYREISKEARISPRDIGVILNKAIEGKKTEGLKEEEQDNVNSEKNQEQRLSLSAQAYKLFSNGRTPLEVSIELNLRESEATIFYREYWKLKQLHNLNMVYEEIKDDIDPFLKLYRLARAIGMDVEKTFNLLKIANNDLPTIEEQSKRLRNDVSMLQSQKHTLERSLYQLNNRVAATTRLLNSFRICCQRVRREIEDLQNEKARLEVTLTEFKNNNEEYLMIKQVAEDKVKSVLMNGKILLKFAVASVIESLRRKHELCNFVLNDISNNTDTDRASYGPNYPSLSLSDQQKSFNYLSDDIYSALVLQESEKLYNKLTTKLTNEVIAGAAAVRGSSSLSLLPPSCNNNKQKLMYENDRYDETEEPRYNNNQS